MRRSSPKVRLIETVMISATIASPDSCQRAPMRSPTLNSLASFWSRGTIVDRTAYVLGTLLLTSGLVHALILLMSGGSWDGPLSMRKAASFGAAFGLTLITIARVTMFVRLQEGTRTGLLAVFSFACVVEVVLVSIQAW